MDDLAHEETPEYVHDDDTQGKIQGAGPGTSADEVFVDMGSLDENVIGDEEA